VESIDLNALTTLVFAAPEAEDLVNIGKLKMLDTSYLTLLSKNEKSLTRRDESAFFNKTASDDAILRSLSEQDQGTVFASDSVLTLLMSCTRAIYPWDIIVRRVGNKIFLDKREGSKIDLLTVGETSLEPPLNDKDMNSAIPLSKEATLIDQYFARQVVTDAEEHSIDFNTDSIPSDFVIGNSYRGYRYRRWDLSETVRVVARCDVDGADIDKNGEQRLININALSEYDSKLTGGIDYRARLDNQPGAVFANELKANGCKLTRWAARNMLSGVDNYILG
jgi:translation initiation factor 3 subunit D